MKKFLCITFMFVLCAAFSAHAVVIHWSVEGYSGANTLTSVQLVYVSSGVAPVYAADVLSNGSNVGAAVTAPDLSLTPLGVGEQSTVDSVDRSGDANGAYYVVLFDNIAGVDSFRYGLTSLANDDTASITADIFSPATSVYDANLGGVSDWAPVPEPGSAALLALGLAALAFRRKKQA